MIFFLVNKLKSPSKYCQTTKLSKRQILNFQTHFVSLRLYKRTAIPDEESALAIKEIVKNTNLPFVCDIILIIALLF